MLVLDTHVLIWAHKGIRIPKRTEKQIAAAARRNELFVSAITAWEIAVGVRRGKIRVSGDVLEWIHEALDAVGAVVASLEPAVAVDAVNLPAWEHADPADRIIVATARRLGARLATSDSSILEYATETKALQTLEI
jgi:PIN domain nuclease of toxin-antitoxin system